MQLVEEYFRRANAAAAEAEKRDRSGIAKGELKHLAEQWESLARARLELIGHQPIAPTTLAKDNSERTVRALEAEMSRFSDDWRRPR